MGNIDQLIAKLAQDAAAVKPAPHPFILSLKWMIVSVFYLFALLMLTGLRPDLTLKLHEPWFAAEIAALAGIFISTSLSAALLSYPDFYHMRRIALAPIVIFALFVAVIFFSCRADNPPAPLPIHSYQCTISIALFALLPAVLALYMMRKLASTHYHWAGSIALLSAFSVGALWLRLHEMNNSIMHVIQWHYLPMIGVGIVGLWLGKVVLKW